MIDPSEKHAFLPDAEFYRRMSDAEFDGEVDRNPYRGRQPGTEPNFGRVVMVAIASILVLIVGIAGLIVLYRW